MAANSATFEREMRPQRFAAVIMRIKDPKTTALVFASGKMVSLSRLLEALTHDTESPLTAH